MNIYAQEGTKVKYLGKNGYDHDKKDIEKLGVKTGDIFTVESTVIGNWMTMVHFKEISGVHNSVMFEEVE